ncbi:hypothetical protein RJT34_26274 [Clitoria ternatea]|uniref:Uncharacterized protein n=1 Tax=Clitoria ternatea TaxID=43366 RepID=A0AAN9FBM3_CLITE
MVSENFDISVLVVDNDETSLAYVASVLHSFAYKVLTANGAENALKTLTEFEGFFDLVVTELYVSGMNGFEFQKHIQNEFQIPVIVMSSDSRGSVISRSLDNGAAHYILKPICIDSLKDIWQYAMVARKGNLLAGDKTIVKEVNSPATPIVTTESKTKRKYEQRNSTEMNDQSNDEACSRLVKKPKVVWTTYLHNLFLLAIEHIGFDRAVPKKILEIMDVPNLTRENIASHLQKYRNFLKKVADKGQVGGLSSRAQKSRFASGLSESMLRDLQTITKGLHVPVEQYLRSSNYAFKPSSQVSTSSYVTTPLGTGHQFPYSLHKGLNLMLQNQHNEYLNQARFRQSSFVPSNEGAASMQEKIFGNYNSNHFYNAGDVVFPEFGMSLDLMSSTNGLLGGSTYGDLMNQNYGNSLGNHQNFSYVQGNRNLESLNNNSTNNIPWATSTYGPSSNIQVIASGLQMESTKEGCNSVGASTVDPIGSKNSFGLTNKTTQHTNMNVAMTSSGNGNIGLAQGDFVSASANASEVPQALITNNGTSVENVSRISQLPQQKSVNLSENKHQGNASSLGEGMGTHFEDDLFEIFLTPEDVNLLKEIAESLNASEFSSLEQSNRDGDVIVDANPTKSTLNLPDKFLTSSHENSDLDWDELVETFFGDKAN